jgi:hypothetical protein
VLHERARLVELEDLLFDGESQGSLRRWVAGFGLFSSQRVRVLRETPKMRLKPRKEVRRSW